MMIDHSRNATLILGLKNPAIVARNEKNRARWELRNKEFRRLNDQLPLATIAYGNVKRSLACVQSASSQFERDDRFRNMYDYQDEVLELALADRELVLKDFKKSSLVFKAQKKRSENARVKVGDTERPLREHILELISKHERGGETASQLWPHFINLLSELGCDPKELSNSKGRLQVEYDFPRSKRKRNSDGEPIKAMTFGRFQNLVSELRKSR
jgi:hypothetical protein